MQISQSLIQAAGRGAALAMLTACTTFGLNAQRAIPQVTQQSSFYLQSTKTSTMMAANEPVDKLGYSTSAGEPEAEAATNYLNVSGLNAMQPPPRRYGRRPVYADSAHNADGSNKYTFFGGAGFTLPTGGTNAYYKPSYNFQVGGGRNFNKQVALVAQFDYANFGIKSGTRSDLLDIYNSLGATDGNGNALTDLGGRGHVWSFSLDPMYSFIGGDKAGAYVIGGVGFYHKVTDFTTPTEAVYYDYYYGYVPYLANATVDRYVSNAVGFNGGIGFTFKPSRFGNEKFYAEARYVYTDNKRRPFFDGTNGIASSPNYFNVFPQNSAPTTFIPITFGVRF